MTLMACLVIFIVTAAISQGLVLDNYYVAAINSWWLPRLPASWLPQITTFLHAQPHPPLPPCRYLEDNALSGTLPESWSAMSGLQWLWVLMDFLISYRCNSRRWCHVKAISAYYRMTSSLVATEWQPPGSRPSSSVGTAIH